MGALFRGGSNATKVLQPALSAARGDYHSRRRAQQPPKKVGAECFWHPPSNKISAPFLFPPFQGTSAAAAAEPTRLALSLALYAHNPVVSREEYARGEREPLLLLPFEWKTNEPGLELHMGEDGRGINLVVAVRPCHPTRFFRF